MPKATPIDKFAEQIENILYVWEAEIQRGVQEAVDEVGKLGAKTVQANAKSKIHSNTYHKGWTYTPEHTRLVKNGRIHNKTEYQLAHLLEKGHVTRNGTGRTYKPTPAHPHIAEVEDMIVDKFEQELFKVVK